MAAVLVAELAVFAMRPRQQLDSAAVPATEVAPAGQIERAEDYRSAQRRIAWVVLAIDGGLLVLIALGRPAPVGRLLRRAGSRPLLGAAAAGAAISVTLSLAGLPLAALAHERARDVGLATQSLAPWLADRGKAVAIGAGLTAVGAALGIAIIRRFGRHWWLPASGAIAAIAVVFSWLAPVILDPVFNDFRPVRDTRLRTEVRSLADRAGVTVGDVLEVDASRRSTALNAYVGGIGSTKRVVLYDTTLDGLERRQLQAIVAHELAHQRHHDIPRGLLWLAIVTPLGVVFVREAATALAEHRGIELGSPAGVSALALPLAIAIVVLTVPGNQLSRAVEARADVTALAITDDPQAQIDLQERLVRRNVSEPDPPSLPHLLFGTHPTAVERIGQSRAWARGERPATDPLD